EPETVRFFLLATHYRRPIDFSDDRIEEVGRGMQAFYRFFERYQRITGESFHKMDVPGRKRTGSVSGGTEFSGEFETTGSHAEFLFELKAHRDRYLEAMDDDFNTGGAVGVLFDLLRTLNGFADRHDLEGRGKSDAALQAALRRGATVLRVLSGILGLFHAPVEQATVKSELTGQLLDLLVDIRKQVRAQKNFALADEIRKRLLTLGVSLEDRPDGTVWRVQS
ncbi:MAG: cysteine--tRNA ligase, partial [Planctomycetes bacterium]|nr:cysteine--tRNA ligase [Planctomycetota bacterium]